MIRTRVLLAAVVGALAIQLALLGLLWARTYHPLPWHDEWDTMRILMRVAGGDWIRPWLALHNEHRLVVPRLIFAIDFWLFRGLELFTFAMSAVLALGMVALFALQARSIAGTRPERAALAASLAAMLLCGQQASNFLWSFQVQWFAVHFFMLAAVAAIVQAASPTRPAEPGRAWRWWTISIACGIASNYSTASGNLTWGAILVAAVLLRSRLRPAMVWLIPVAGAASAGAYAVGFQTSQIGSGSLSSLLSDPLAALHFMLRLFGTPFAPFGSFAPAVMGTVFLVAAALLAARVFRAGLHARSGADAFTLAALAFVLASGIVTTAGRAGMGVEAATESRLGTVTAIGWACIMLQAATWLFLGRRFALLAVLLAGASAVGIAGFIRTPYQYLGLRPIKTEATSAIVAGVADEAVLQRVGFSGRGGPDMVRFLRERERSIFADPASRAVGRSLREVVSSLRDGCEGAIDVIAPIAGNPAGVRLEGWSWDKSAAKPVGRLLIADDSGRVVGVGFRLVDRPDVVAAKPYVATSRVGWVGRAPAGSGSVHVFALVDGESRACKLGDARIAIAPAVPAASWVPSPPWKLYEPGLPPFIREVRGLSIVESFGRWTDSKRVDIEFAARLPSRFDLALVAGGFGPNVGAEVQVLVGGASRSFRVESDVFGMKSYTIRVDNPESSPVITLVIPAPTAPKDIGIASPDTRKLGIAIQSLEIRPLPEARPPPER